MNVKPQAIRKSDILSVVGMKYKDYERQQCVPSKFNTKKVVAKLINRNKFPDFSNILSEISIIFPLESNENTLDKDEWLQLEVILK